MSYDSTSLPRLQQCFAAAEVAVTEEAVVAVAVSALPAAALCAVDSVEGEVAAIAAEVEVDAVVPGVGEAARAVVA